MSPHSPCSTYLIHSRAERASVLNLTGLQVEHILHPSLFLTLFLHCSRTNKKNVLKSPQKHIYNVFLPYSIPMERWATPLRSNSTFRSTCPAGMSWLHRDMMCETVGLFIGICSLYNLLSNYADPFESKRATTKYCVGTTGKIRVYGHTSREKT